MTIFIDLYIIPASWYNENCGLTKGFICRRADNIMTTPRTPQPTGVVSGYCPRDYVPAGRCVNHQVTSAVTLISVYNLLLQNGTSGVIVIGAAYKYIYAITNGTFYVNYMTNDYILMHSLC